MFSAFFQNPLSLAAITADVIRLQSGFAVQGKNKGKDKKTTDAGKS